MREGTLDAAARESTPPPPNTVPEPVMTETVPHVGRCPRCGTPVTGAMKFCPACAYRLAPTPVPPRDDRRSGGRWLQALVLLVFALLVVGVVQLGIRTFRGPEHAKGTPAVVPIRSRLTVRDDLRRLMVSLDAGFADYVESKEGLKWVHVGAERMLKFEVTRGMYAEYVEACQEDPTRIPAFLRDAWRPKKTGQEERDAERLRFARAFVDHWWARVRDVVRERSGRDPPRPRDFAAPLPERYDTLIVVPPSWIFLTPYEELRWELPAAKGPIPENLPVTDVSWLDAEAFAAWASDVLGLEANDRLRLPTLREWLRAGRAGDGKRRYPWGDEPLVYACNSQSFWHEDQTAELLPVDYRYSDDGGGVTPEDIWAMSGNAREWVRNDRLVEQRTSDGGVIFGIAAPDNPPEEDASTAPTVGGSYLDGILDCTVTTEPDSLGYRDKGARFEDVGFRLWMRGSWTG